MATGEVTETAGDNGELEKAIALLTPMIDAGKSEDEMVVSLIQNGFKFTKAARMLPRVMEAKGMRLSAKDRYASVSEFLTNQAFAPASWDDVEDAVANLTEEVDNTSAGQALSCIKRFAREHEIELPEKPKGAGGGGRSRGSSADAMFHDWACKNQSATDDDVVAYVQSIGVTEKQAPRYIAAFLDRLNFARKFKAA